MGLESSFNFIDDLNSTNPATGDDVSEGDDHLRGIKNAVKGSFTSLGSAAVTKTAAEINDLAEKSSIQTISGAWTFTDNVTIDKADPQLSIKCADESTEPTILAFLDELSNSRSLVYRPPAFDGLRIDVRNAAGTPQAALLLTEAGGVDVSVGTFSATSAVLPSPVINTGVSGTAVLDEDDMVSDSATQLATQQSIKAYADSKDFTTGTFIFTSLANGASSTARIAHGLGNIPVNFGASITDIGGSILVASAAQLTALTRENSKYHSLDILGTASTLPTMTDAEIGAGIRNSSGSAKTFHVNWWVKAI